MNRTVSQYVIGTTLGLAVFLRGIVGTYEMMFLGQTVPIFLTLLIRGAVALGFLALIYAILFTTRSGWSVIPPSSRSNYLIILVAVFLWMSIPGISSVPKTVVTLFPGLVSYTGGIYGYVLVLGTLTVSGTVWSCLVINLFGRAVSDEHPPRGTNMNCR